MSKSQTATEYLILLAVVVVIALVAINTLGGFPGIGSSSEKKVSDVKLQISTIGVASYSIETSGSLFKLKNNFYDTITINEFRLNQQTNLTCNSSNTNPALPIVLNVGQSVIVNCTAVNSSNYIITNKQTPLIGILYTDSITSNRLAGNSNSYGAVSVSGGGQTYTPNSTVLALRQGLVAYYPFDGNTSDLNLNVNNGTNNGASYNSSGKVGGGYSFDGITSNILLPFSFTNGSGNTIYTMSAWIKTSNINGRILTSCSNSFTDSRGIVSANSVTNNVWHHIIAIRNGTNMYLYIDGNLNGSVATSSGFSGVILAVDGTGKIDWRSFNVNSQTTSLVGKFAYDALIFNGSIDEVSIWNRALNSSDVLDLYNGGNGLSLSLSGPQTPICSETQISCNGTVSSVCTNGNWINAGNISGQCGYFPPGNLSALRQGLVAYYPFDGNTSDLSGHGYNGINYSATYTALGKVGGAYSFDGVNSFVEIGSAPYYYQGSLSLWFYANSFSGQPDLFVGNENTTNSGNYLQVNINSNSALSFYNPTAPYIDIVTASNVVSTGQWYNVIWTSNGSTTSCYVNSVQKSLTVNAGDGKWFGNVTNINHYTIGKLLRGSQSYSKYNGLIDEVTLWNRSLNSTEVLQIYNSSYGFSLVQ
jgi:hypothetical protein